MQEAKGNVLPKLTQDIQQCRRDLDKWGYCLIDKCCSDAQVAMYRERLHEQAEAELLAGVNNGPSRPSMRQNVWSLINKGGDSRMFEDFLETFVIKVDKDQVRAASGASPLSFAVH